MDKIETDHNKRVIHIHSIKLDNADIIWRSKIVICYVDNFVSLPSKLNITHKH